MSSRLAFQTQLASIMEVLANAAVAEICKLVDDDYAVVSLQMSQCQRENKALKRKLHLLELKMARGYAERRLRESAMNSRPNSRVHIEKFRGSTSSSGVVYDRQLDPMGMWSGGPGANNDHNNSSQMHSNPIQDESPDLQLVEPDSLLVKEETMEDPLGDTEGDDVPLIREDGMVECGPRTGGSRTGPGEAPSHPATSAQGPEQLSPPPQHPGPRSRHRVEPAAGEESDPDILLIKVEDLDPPGGDLSIQEGVRDCGTDDYRAGAMALEAPHRTSPLDPTHHHPGTARHHPSTEVSYGRSSFDSQPLPSLLWTNGGGGGDASVPGPSSLSISYPAGPSLGRLIMGGRLGPAGPEIGQHRGFTGESSGSFGASAGSREVSELTGHEVAAGGSGDPQGQDWYKCGRKKVVRKKTFLCKFCGKGFSSPANLEPHLRTHTGERPFGCTVCGKHFSQYWNLKIHKNVHTGERPYACPLCGERYADPSNLKKHQKRHHPQQ